MSDKYAPNLTTEEMQKILEEEEVGCLCMSVGDEPYAVPVSYAWLDGRIVFHCATEGRKLDVLKQNPRVCFVVDRSPDRVRPHRAACKNDSGDGGKCTYRFESVICFGTARVLDTIPERFEWLQRFKSYFYARLDLATDEDPVTPAAAEHCGCVVIEIERMTGRHKD